MERKRRQHSAEFKARVALEALRGIKTINQIAEENEIHPVQVSQWKLASSVLLNSQASTARLFQSMMATR